MDYAEFSYIPEYERARWVGDELKNPDAPVKWGGLLSPPEVGAKVKVTMNNLGRGIVVGYFVEGGWLGLRVKLHNPPAWRNKQLNGNPPALVFGPEFRVEE